MGNNNQKIKIAAGTDDQKTFTEEHFGSAKYFLIYEWNRSTSEIGFVKSIPNLSPEERLHGDPKKAKNISQLMKSESVDLLLAKRMGVNVTKMRKKFIPIITNIPLIEDAVSKLPELAEKIEAELIKPENEQKKLIKI